MSDACTRVREWHYRRGTVEEAHLMRCSVSQFQRFFSEKFVSTSPAVASRAPKSYSGLDQSIAMHLSS